MADYRDLAIALGGGYGQDTGGITPDTLATLRNGKTASASDLLGMLKAIGSGSLSNLESLVRGGVAQIPGTAGDLEGLARMGINKAFGAGGVNVSPTPVLPTTTDILGMMPRNTAARPETAGMEELGGYMSPAFGKVAVKAIKATEGMPVGMGIKPTQSLAVEPTYKGSHTAPSLDMSKIRNQDGSLKTVYHGTPDKFDKFSIDEDKRGVGGIWFTDSGNYAYDMSKGNGWDSRKIGSKGRVISANLASENPMIFDVVAESQKLAKDIGVDLPSDSLKAQELLAGTDGWDSFVSDLVKDAKKLGHDSLVIENFNDGRMVDSTAYVIFDPSKIVIK